MTREQDSPPTVPDRADYDSPWKKALEVYFKEFIGFFFREMAADLDWSRGYVFLDKELQQVAREAAFGRRYVDKLPATCPPVPVFCKRVFGSRGGDGRRVASSGEAGGAGAALQAVCVWGRTSLTH